MGKIKVLLVDDQILFVESLKTVLETSADDIEIIGQAYDGNQALKLVEERGPDIILMDVRMPDMSGVECSRLIKQKYPAMRIIMLTTRSVCKGGLLISPKVARKLVGAILTHQEGHPEKIEESSSPEPAWLKELTQREKDILFQISQSYNNKEIADRLFIAEQTVRNYISIIYSKMGVRNRMQAQRLAKEVRFDKRNIK